MYDPFCQSEESHVCIIFSQLLLSAWEEESSRSVDVHVPVWTYILIYMFTENQETMSWGNDIMNFMIAGQGYSHGIEHTQTHMPRTTGSEQLVLL